jgi:hypothetical protein
MSKRGKIFKEPSLTQQNFASECDINKIVQRFTQTGLLPQSRKQPRYGVAEGDFQAAHFALALANSKFETLEPEVREKYGNIDNIVSALNDPDLASEMHEDGIYDVFELPYKVPKQNGAESPLTAPERTAAAQADASIPAQPKIDE